MAIGFDVTEIAISEEILQENAVKYIAYLSIELDERERKGCEWEEYLGTSVNLTKEQVVDLRDKLNKILGEKGVDK